MMHKIIKILIVAFLIAIAIFLIVLGFGIYKFNFTNDDVYVVNNGTSSSSKYWGGDLKGDFDDNGIEDVVFIVTKESGGSELFYYVTALMNKETTVPDILLGDRIAPQTINVEANNVIAVNYADRNKGESFAIKPSLGKTLRLKIDPKSMQFGIVLNNFEGEADINKMNLTMKTWSWIKTSYNNDTEIKPKIADKFQITFKADKTFSVKTDCNGVGGTYTVSGKTIKFERMMSTLMYCEGSQEQDFVKILTEAQSFLFTSKGELIFNLKMDSGTAVFR